MKCTIPEISWHNREPVLSVHIHPHSDKFYRLATGGADCHVLIWQLNINDNGAVKMEALSDLTRHQKAVNSVRWSPEGQYLATADDDANIIIWQLKTDNIPSLDGETNDKETWIVHKVLRGHKEDIYDLCWSPNGSKLLTGSIDNTAILWDLGKGKNDHILTDHKGFVQGVAWDPKGFYIATISTDRICRIFESSGKQVKSRIQKGCLPVPTDHYLHNKEVKFFHDDTFKSFFRRLDFSPDGALLAVPSVRVEIEDNKNILNGTLILAVDSWTMPLAVLPSGKQCSTVVRFCPLLFELHEEGPVPIISLPFRMIVAVGTDHDIILYDTQQMVPFAYFKDIHYTRLTDLTWSPDGLLLVASSTDGFCALITFEPDELGIQYVKEESEVEESIMDVSGCEELEKEEETAKPKKLNLLEQWAIKTPKKGKKKTATCTNSDKVNIIEDDIDIDKRKCEEDNRPAPVKNVKKIKPIPVEDNLSKIKPTPVDDYAKKVKSTQENKVRRIKPVLIQDTKVIDKNVKRKETTSPNVNPLISFLKGAKDETPKKKVVAPPTNIILDEVEARDAWKCDKEEQKTSDVITISDDDYTEDFSLHLEDTNSKSCVQEAVDIEEMKSTSKEENTENCVQSKVESDTTKSSVESEKPADKIQTSAEDKVNIAKRRIPLITLSSPKHKKK